MTLPGAISTYAITLWQRHPSKTADNCIRVEPTGVDAGTKLRYLVREYSDFMREAGVAHLAYLYASNLRVLTKSH